MDPEARRRACVEFRVKLIRDTGVNLTAAVCEGLLEGTFELEGELVSLLTNPGLFYTCLGKAVEHQLPPYVLLDYAKVALWCFREAADVHKHPKGMGRLAESYHHGMGVTEDTAQAAVWYQKAADLGDAASKAVLGNFLLKGDARAGVAQDAARGFQLIREAVALGFSAALYLVAQCYLKGEGVEKDAVHGVSLLRQVINQDDASRLNVDAATALAECYMEGNGVAADTVQAALWCQSAAKGGDVRAIELLPIIRKCDFCGNTPARQLCTRCRKVRYCDHQCQLAHWNHATDPHKGPCKEHRRRAAEAAQQEAGGASTFALQ